MSEISVPGSGAPASEYLRLAKEAIRAENHRAAFDVLVEGCRHVRAQLDAGDEGALAGYVDLSISLSRFVHKDDAVRVLGGVRARAQEAGSPEHELAAVGALFYRHAEEGDWQTVLHYANAFPGLASAWRQGGAGDGELSETVDVLLRVTSDSYGHAMYQVSSALADIAVRLAAYSPDAWRMLAWSHLRQKNGEEAIEAFSKTIELEPGRAGSYRGLAYACQLAGRHSDSLAAMDRAVACADSTVTDVFGRADFRTRAGDYSGALADLQAVELMLRDAPASERTETWRQLQPGPAAEAEYIRNMPGQDLRDFAMLMRVSLLRKLNRADEAEQCARDLVENGDRATVAGASSLLAALLMERDPPAAEEAAGHYTRAIQSGLRDGGTYLDRAHAYLAAGNSAAALDDLEVICDGHETKLATRAVALLTPYVREHADDHDAQVVLGRCLLEARRPAEAIAALDQALAHQPANWRGLLWRGLARVTVSYGEDEVAQAWNEVLPFERTSAALADLAAATVEAPTASRDQPQQALVWLVERLVFLRDSYGKLVAPESAMHRLVVGAVPELGEVFRNLGIAALDHRPGAFQRDIDLYLPARDLAVRHGFRLIAARIDMLLADNYLRLYELQRALDHVAAVEAVLPAIGYLPGGVSADQEKEDADIQRRGEMKINWDLDHIGLSVLVTMQVLLEVSLYRAEAVSRAGAPERSLRELSSLPDQIVELVASGYADVHLGIHLISLLRDAGEIEKATQVLDTITPAAAEAGESRDVSNLRATLHARRGEWAEAERILLSTVETDSQEAHGAELPHHAMVSVLNLASVAMKQRRYQDVLDLLGQYSLPPDARYRVAYGWRVMRGQCHFNLRNYSAAYDDLIAAIDMTDSVRGKLRDQDLRITWQAGLSDVYEKAFFAAVFSFKFSGVFDLMERSRARAFVDQLSLRGTATPAVQELAEAVERCRRRRRLLRQLLADPGRADRTEIARQLTELGRGPEPGDGGDGLPATDPAQILAILTSEGASLQKLEQDLERERLAEHDSVAGRAVTYDEIWEFLLAAGRPDGSPGSQGKRIVLAEYYFTANMLTLFIVAVNIPGPIKQVIEYSRDEVLQFTKSAFGTAAGADGAARAVFDEARFQSLFHPFVAPIAEFCDPGDLLWIVPHGFLHYVPLHAVEIDGQPLIARNPVIYTPSASVLPPCHARAAGRGRRSWDSAAVLGDSRGDLPHARAEARAVAELFGTEAHVGGAATGPRLQNLIAADPDVLHLACHGRFDTADVFQSGLLLAASPAAAGALDHLTVEELLGLRLDVGLVTLSACKSGISDLRPGDELIGLTRALLHAGAPSVLVSLWPVSDLSTSFFMREFYRRVREAPAVAPGRLPRALAGAQQYLMNLTAAQAVELCDERLTAVAEPTGRLTAELDRAGVQIMAGDLAAAIACYRHVARSLRELPGPLAASLLRTVLEKLPLLELKAEADASIDYSRRPFAHPYFWAPFILVGDWQ